MIDLQKLGHQLLKDNCPELEEQFTHLDYLLGKLILSKRIRKGLTQEQLANVCDLPLKTIHRVEGGNEDITLGTYMTIFKVLGISTNDVGAYITRKLN